MDLVVQVVGETSAIEVFGAEIPCIELNQNQNGAFVIEVPVQPPAVIVNQPAAIEFIEIIAPGPAGPGVPAGGLSGQVLRKASGADYQSEWCDQVLVGTGNPPDPSGVPDGTLFVKIL